MRHKKLRPHPATGLIAVLFLLAAARLSLTQAMQNLVINPDFEEGAATDQPGLLHRGSSEVDTWQFLPIRVPAAGTVDTADKHSGNSSYRVDVGPGGQGWVRSLPFAVRPNTRYQVSAWVKAGGNIPARAAFRVVWRKKGDAGAPASVTPLSGAAQWKRAVATVTSPPDAANACLLLVAQANSPGTGNGSASAHAAAQGAVWFDGIAFTPIGD